MRGKIAPLCFLSVMGSYLTTMKEITSLNLEAQISRCFLVKQRKPLSVHFLNASHDGVAFLKHCVSTVDQKWLILLPNLLWQPVNF